MRSIQQKLLDASNGSRTIASGNAIQGADPEELAAVLSSTIGRTKIETTTEIAFESAFYRVGDLIFGHGHYNGDFCCLRETSAQMTSILIPSHGAALLNYGRQELLSRVGWATIADTHQDNSIRFQGERKHLSLFVEQRMLSEKLAHVLERPINGSLSFHPHLDLTMGPGRVLEDLVKIACNALNGGTEAPLLNAPLALANLSDTIVSLLLEATVHRYSKEMQFGIPVPAPRHVKWAIDFMHAHLSDPITISDIATASRVSIRALQSGFRRFRTTTPIAYLQQLRLYAAHGDLVDPLSELSVAQVARKWGYSHIGRFAADYKKRFGCLPSETLRENRVSVE